MEPEAQKAPASDSSDDPGNGKRPWAMRGALPSPPLPSPLRNPVVLMTAVGVALVVVVFWRYWGGNDVTASALLNATFIGIAVGSLYAMYATGLVVVYTTTGIFNFAQGAVGVLCAFLFWELNVNRGWHTLLALFFVVLVFAPALGILLDVILMRRLRTAPLVVQLMATVALMVLLLSLTGEIWEQDTTRTVNFFFGLESSIEIFNVNILWHRLITIFTAIGLAIGLSVFLFRSRLGVAMRAVVDNRELSALNGVRPGLISSSAWAIGCSLAALGGILIAPEISLDPTNLNIIIITAFAAATFGALRSLPLTVVGALIIGLLRQNTLTWLNFGSDFRFVSEAVAPVLLFIVVLALPRAQLTVGRIATNLKKRERLTTPPEAIFGLVVLIFLALVFSKGWLNFGIWDPGEWGSAPLNRMNVAMGLAIMGLSLVPLTGWAGQINFAPLAFGGFGAFLYLKLAGIGGINNGWWILIVAVLSAPLGALVAIPASRLRGLFLALASMAFAQAMALLFFPHSAIIPSTAVGVQFGPIRLFGITFSERESYFMLLVSVFAIIVFALVLLRRSRYGRRWIALNDSQAASATVGVSVNLTKVVVYAVSAAIAGMGGAFWATSNGSLEGVRSFDVINGLEIVLLMAAAGVSIPLAGIFLVFRPVFEGLTERLYDLGNVDWLAQFFDIMTTFGPGLLALGMVINQRGAIYEMGRGFAPILPWRKDAREEIAKERAQKRDTEFGELGITKPFTANEIIALDRRLRITDEVTPPGGYGSGGNGIWGNGTGEDESVSALSAVVVDTPLLAVESVDMRFGGVQALSDVNLRVERGTITSLIGPNGAGKTTLFNVITGLLEPTSGRVYFKGWDITGLSVTRRSRLGIARTFQKLEAFNSLSIRDNILVAVERRRRRDQHEHRHPASIADELLEIIGLEDMADITVGTLPTGTARLVELARALALAPNLLLLDEPSSGLNEEETQAVARLLERTVSDDLAVFLVEHDMSLVMDISHEIYVLDFGELIAHGNPEETQNDPKVRAAYLGSH